MKSNNQNNIEEELHRRGSSLYKLNHPNSKIKEKVLKKYIISFVWFENPLL